MTEEEQLVIQLIYNAVTGLAILALIVYGLDSLFTKISLIKKNEEDIKGMRVIADSARKSRNGLLENINELELKVLTLEGRSNKTTRRKK